MMMMALRAVVAVSAVAACAVAAPDAGAAFAPPTELAQGQFGVGAPAATDASGATTVVMVGVSGGAQLAQRDGGAAPWPPAAALPGRELGKVAGPVVAAAGRGAAAIAWRVDAPKRYGAIAALARDPGGAFGADAQVVSAPDANGVRHPALAVDGLGGALLAYNTDTRKAHLSLKGAVAVSLRASHASFATPVVVDPRPAGAPVVAVGDDGTGVVAWIRERRVWAVSVDVSFGRMGTARAVTPRGSYDGLQAAAGPDGAATLAYVTRQGDQPSARRVVAALRRPAGGAFSGRRAQVVSRLGRDQFLQDFALAADEDGRTTLAWSPERFGRDRSLGINGVTSGVRVALAEPGAGRFGAAHEAFGDRGALCDPPALAATTGAAVLAYACRDRNVLTAYATRVDGARIGRPERLRSSPALPISSAHRTPVSAGLDADGNATITLVWPEATPGQPAGAVTERVLTSTGR